MDLTSLKGHLVLSCSRGFRIHLICICFCFLISFDILWHFLRSTPILESTCVCMMSWSGLTMQSNCRMWAQAAVRQCGGNHFLFRSCFFCFLCSLCAIKAQWRSVFVPSIFPNCYFMQPPQVAFGYQFIPCCRTKLGVAVQAPQNMKADCDSVVVLMLHIFLIL